MELNMVTAELEYIGSSVRSIDIDANMINISNEVPKTFRLDIQCSQPMNEEDGKYGKLLMQVEVSLQNEDEPQNDDTFRLVLEGLFKVSSEMPDEKFMELLNINGGAALFSIARAKMEVLSSLTYADGKILLPMVNILQYFEERKKIKE